MCERGGNSRSVEMNQVEGSDQIEEVRVIEGEKERG